MNTDPQAHMEHLGEMLVISPSGTLPTSLPSAWLPGLYNCSFLFSSGSFSQPPSSCAILFPLHPSHTFERHSQESLTPLIPQHPLSTMSSSQKCLSLDSLPSIAFLVCFCCSLPVFLFLCLFHLDYLPLALTPRRTILHIIHQLHSLF